MIGTAPRAMMAWNTRNAVPAELAPLIAVVWLFPGVTINGVLADGEVLIFRDEMLSFEDVVTDDFRDKELI